jgi:hypothetical protein
MTPTTDKESVELPSAFLHCRNTLCIFILDDDVDGCGQRVQLVLWVWLVGVVFAPDANSEELEPICKQLV